MKKNIEETEYIKNLQELNYEIFINKRKIEELKRERDEIQEKYEEERRRNKWR